jgi:dihydroorotase
VANTALRGRMKVVHIIERFCHGPRRVLGLTVPHIAAGEMAEITLFDPEVDWTFAAGDIRSRSGNTPFIGQPFTGRPLGIIANGRSMIAGKIV